MECICHDLDPAGPDAHHTRGPPDLPPGAAAEPKWDGYRVQLAPWSFAQRQAALETLFTDTPLTAPFTLYPSTTDPATAQDWLTWTSAGLKGLCFKRLLEPYRTGARA
ncbi:hypothetical protein [Streptomyces sp. NPDC057336]|uniref:hypothetical protein n=1 Tax=Streptomyces sp. NPDC057336 TaxID=3346102 RepID=UPI003633AA7A